MSKKEVVHWAGEPRKRTYDDDLEKGSAETWYYDYHNLQTNQTDAHVVKFIDGRVVNLSEDPNRIQEIAHEKEVKKQRKIVEETIPVDVGFKCVRDSECQSRHCIENKCAGPRGCLRPVGAECVTSTDCCSQHCDGFSCRLR